jgi:hypothetical protein
VEENIQHGLPVCISFGQMRVDQTVSMEVLKVIQPQAIEAALEAAAQTLQRQSDVKRTLQLDLTEGRGE